MPTNFSKFQFACAAGLAASAFFTVADVTAQTECTVLEKLTSADGQSSDSYGEALALDEDVAVVGAPFANEFANGAAYVLRRLDNVWTLEQKLTPAAPVTADLFGAAVSIDGDVIVVGAYFDSGLAEFTGAAYVFRNVDGTWIEEAKLVASDGVSFDRFGYSVAVSGDFVFVTAFADDNANGGDAGSVYVFERNGSTWSQAQHLVPADGGPFENFGASIAIFGDTAIIGATQETFADGPGRAVIYRLNGATWEEEDQITADDGLIGDGFGSSAAFDGETALVGARGVDVVGVDSGAVYAFQNEAGIWTQVGKLVAPDASDFDAFAVSMSVYSGAALIGAEFDDDRGNNSGAVYLFRNNGTSWEFDQKIVPDDGEAEDRFGSAVALNGDWALIGSPRADQQATDAGAVYSYPSLFSPDCNGNGVADACDLLAVYSSTTGPLSPVGFGTPLSYTFTSPPDSAGTVTLSFEASGDLGSANEFLTVSLNDVVVGIAYGDIPADDCQPVPLTDEVTISASTFNTLVNGGDAQISISASSDVDENLCLNSYVTVDMSYETLNASSDCNVNGVPDECESDCNLNGIADACDLSSGTSEDCQANTVPDECELGIGGLLLVASKESDSVIGYDASSGVLVGDVIAPGTGGLNYPNGLVVDDEGFLYVSSVDSDNVLKYSLASGQEVLAITTPGLTSPVGLVVKDPDRLLVSSYSVGSILEFNRNTGAFIGDFVAPNSGGLDGPGYMTIGPNGNLFVASARSDQILEYDGETGAFVGVAVEAGTSGLNYPIDLLFTGNGTILVVSFFTNSVLEYAEDGTFLSEFVESGSGGLSGPEAISQSPDGHLLVSSYYTNEVLKYSILDGQFISVFASGGGLNQPTDILVLDETGDCNENTILDICDILSGTSTDCDPNGIPDECDIANGAPDCNANNVTDTCENFAGTVLSAPDPDVGDSFGYDVAMKNSWGMMGALADDEAGTDAGAVYVSQQVDELWVPIVKLIGSNVSAGDSFGQAVAMDGDWAVAGAHLDDSPLSDAGSVYVYGRSGEVWTEQAFLVAADPAATDHFGRSLDVSGSAIVVGAPLDDDMGSNSGSAYVFRFDGSAWDQEQKLNGLDETAFDTFTASVAIEDDVIVVGASSADAQGTDSGAAYVFRRIGSTWTQEAKLIGSDSTAFDQFGRTVAIEAGVIAVGAYLHDQPQSDAGAVYVFRYDGANWLQEAKLSAPGSTQNLKLGFSVDFGQGVLYAGAFGDEHAGVEAGSAIAFVNTGTNWTPLPKLTASNPEAGDRFGWSIAADGGDILVGAYLEDGAIDDSGAVHAFAIGGSDCNGNGVPDECDIVSGQSPDTDGDGVPDECSRAVIACSTNTPLAGPFSVVSVDLYVAGVSGLNAFQLEADSAVITGSGSLTFTGCDVDEDRPDFVFAGLDTFTVCSTVNQQVAVVASNSETVDIPIDTPAYLATFTFEVSGDAASGTEFSIFLNESGTYLADELSDLLPYFLGESCTVEIVSCDVPAAFEEGSRYVQVTPQAPVSTAEQAIKVTVPDCPEFIAYVGADGCLTDQPVFLETADWATVHVTGDELAPETEYEFTSLCGTPEFEGGTVAVTTRVWGDVGAASGLPKDDVVNFIDIQKVLQCAEGTFNEPTTIYNADLQTACSGPSCDIFDVFAVSDAFTGLGYPGAVPCGSLGVTGGPRGGEPAQVTLVPPTQTSSPCALVQFTIEAFISEVTDLRGYQLQLETTGGSSGQLSCLDLFVDTDHPEYVFADAPSDDLVFVNGDLCRLSSSLISGGVDVGLDGAYMGTFVLEGSEDAAGEFTALLADQGVSTVLLDSAGQVIPFDAANAELNVLGCEGDANCDGLVDPLDSGYVQSRFNCPVGTGDADCDAADVNGDGIVDPLDTGYVLSRLGTCL